MIIAIVIAAVAVIFCIIAKFIFKKHGLKKDEITRLNKISEKRVTKK